MTLILRKTFGGVALVAATVIISLTMIGAFAKADNNPSSHVTRGQRGATIAELTDASDRIFRGTVRSIGHEFKTVNLKGYEVTSKIRLVTFEVTEVWKNESLKTRLLSDKKLTVHLNDELASHVDVGEEVVWYLSKKNELGLESTVGPEEGFFVLTRDPKNSSQLTVSNLTDNAGLWSDQPGATLWKLISKEKFLHILDGMVSHQVITSKTADEFIKRAGTSYEPMPLPLEFLKAATLASLQTTQALH